MPVCRCHQLWSLFSRPWPITKAAALTHSTLAQVREYLEKNYSDVGGKDAVKLCVKALMELIEASGQTIDLVVMEKDGLRMVPEEEVDALVKEVEADAAASDAARRRSAPGQAAAGGSGQ